MVGVFWRIHSRRLQQGAWADLSWSGFHAELPPVIGHAWQGISTRSTRLLKAKLALAEANEVEEEDVSVIRQRFL